MTFTGNKNAITQWLFKLDKDTIWDIKIEKHRNKRSLDANAYSWVLQNEIANVLRISKEEVHFQMLKEYGQRDYVSLLANINPSQYFDYYEENGTYKNNGNTFKSYLIYKPTRNYNSSEMSIFIDGLVQEAKNLGIQTKEDYEIEQMIKEMESMNEVILIGNLTSDVELRTNEKGTSVVSTTVAINRGTDENGKERPADFIKFYAFNNIAENMPKYCRKGSKICVKGRIVNRSWDKEDGSKAYQTTVYASRVMFLDSRKSNYIPLPEAPEPNFKTPVAEQQEDPFASFGEEVELSDDDLPF